MSSNDVLANGVKIAREFSSRGPDPVFGQDGDARTYRQLLLVASVVVAAISTTAFDVAAQGRRFRRIIVVNPVPGNPSSVGVSLD